MEPLHHPPSRRRRRRRWARRLLISVGVLLVLFIAAVQIVLWTPLPRRIAESQVRKELGADAKIGKVSIGWLGETVVENVTLTLPMANEPIVQIRRLDVRHPFLPAMVFSPTLRSVVVEGLVVDIRQDRMGEWNVQQLFTRPPDPEDDPPPAVLNIPDFKAADVIVKIARNDGRTAELKNIQLKGERQQPLMYAVSAEVSPELRAEGLMALTRDLSHKLDLTLTQVPPQLKALLGELPDPLRARLTWLGRQTKRGPEGTLKLLDAAVDNVRASGDVELFIRDRRPIAEPRGLTVSTVSSPAATQPSHSIVLQGGQISVGERVELRQVRAKLAGGRVAIEGSVHPRTFASDVTVGWENLAGASGSAAVKVIRELTGGVIAAADIKGSFDLAGGRATGSMRINGGGDSLKTLYAAIQTESLDLAYPDGRTLAIPGIELTLRSDGEEIFLSSLRPRDSEVGTVTAVASYHLQRQMWYGVLHARDLKLTDFAVPGVRKPIDLDLDAYGSLTQYNLKEAYLRHGIASYWAEGFYDTERPDPVHIDLWAWFLPIRWAGAGSNLEALHAQAQISGTLAPRRLLAKGALHANELQVRGRHVGDISARVEARLEDNSASITSPDDIELFGGKWRLNGSWSNFPRWPQPFILKVDWRELPIDRLAELPKLKGFSGMVDRGTATITIPSARLRDLTVTVETTASKLQAMGATAEAMNLEAKLVRGEVTGTVTLTSGQGKIVSKLSTSLPGPGPITIAANLDNWPAATPEQSKAVRNMQAYLSGKADVKILPESKSVNSNVQISGRIERDAQPEGEIEIDAYSRNRELTLTLAKVRTLDGEMFASGIIDLANINAARFDAKFNRLSLVNLAWLVPPLRDVSGRYSGELHIHPSPNPRALGPLSMQFNVNPEDGRFRTVDLGDFRMNGFAGYDQNGDFRLVTDETSLKLAGGEVLPFLRLSYTQAHGLTQLVNMDLKNLQLEPLVHAFKPDDRKPMPGVVNGRARLYGSLRSITTLNGEAFVKLTNSDLVNFKPIEFLYNLMRVGTAGTEPRGDGEVVLRVEQAVLHVNSARYFNRGVEVRAFGPVGNLGKLPDSPMKLILVGSAQPLKDIKLPFFGDANKIMEVLQGTLTTVEAGGTLRDPKPRQVFFSELKDKFAGVLLGIVKEEQE